MTGRLASWVMNDLRIKVFRHLQRLSLDFFTEEKAGVVMSRMTSDIENLQQLLQDGLAQFAIQGLTMVVITVFLFATNATLAAITVFAVLPPLVIMSIWFKRASERGYDKVRDGIALVLADLSESLQGVRIVTAHNRQRYNVETHRDIVGSYRDANNYTGRINGVYGPGSQVISVFGQVLILGIGGAMYLHHPQEINLGQLTAFFLYVNRFFSPDPAAGAAVQHVPAGPGVGVQAARPARDRAVGARGARRGGAAADPGRDPLRPRVVRLRPRRAGAARRRPRPSRPGRRWPSWAPPERASRPWPSWSRASTTRPAGRVLIDGYDLKGVTLASLRSQLGRRAPGAVPLRRDDPGQHLVRPARRARRRGVERRAPGRAGRARAPAPLRPRHPGPRAGPVALLGRAPAHRARAGLHGRAPGARARRGHLEPRPQVRDDGRGGARRAARRGGPPC